MLVARTAKSHFQLFLLKRRVAASNQAAIEVMPNGRRGSSGSSTLHTSDSEDRADLKMLKKNLRRKRGNDSCAAQPAVAGDSRKRVKASVLPGSGAAQPAVAASVLYPTVPLSSLSGRIRQYSVCYTCAKGHEIRERVHCSCCNKKRNTVLMVTCPEMWPSTRTGFSCYRCKRQVIADPSGIYTVSRSALSCGNHPICCQCYGVDDPPSHLKE